MKKRRVILVVFLILFGGLFYIYQKQQSLAKRTTFNRQKNEFWLLSDTHFISPDLHDNGTAFKNIQQTTAGKEIAYQTEALSAFIDQALLEKPQGIILTGDVTFNGERLSAKKLQKLFKPLQKKDIAILAIPGNHDIYNGWARAFKHDQQSITDQLSPENFQEYFSDGYQLADSLDKNSLSYSLSINRDYQFLMLDSCIYPNTSSTTQSTVGGRLKKETLTWINQQLLQAQNEEKTTLVFMHHNLYRHNELLNKGFVLENASELHALLQTYHVPAIFSGHIHAQDIQKEKNGPYEIVTGSYPTYELTYGKLTLDTNEINYQKALIDLDDWAENQHLSDKDLLHYSQFQADLFYRNSEALAFDTFYANEALNNDEKKALETFIAKLNVNLFTGHDLYSEVEIEALLNSKEFKQIEQHSPFLTKYVQSLLNDVTNDQQLLIHP